jgi:peroxiredoxin
MKNLLFVLFLIPIIAIAQDKTKAMVKKGVDTSSYIPAGLKIGDKAPVIKGVDLNGKLINSDETLKGKNIVLIFYRGKWCPVCNRYLSNLNDSLQHILNNNAEVFVVGPETFENTEIIADKTESTFTLIPDTSFQILNDYDVLFNVTKKYQNKVKTFLRINIAENNHQSHAQLPVPATYIIGKDGLIKWRHFDYDYTKRASVREIIDHLK